MAEFERINESIEHYNAKMKIVYDGGITINGTFLKAIKVKAEVWIPSIKMQPDVVFLDENDKPYFIVEVKRSNAKSIEDINNLNTLNIPVYEKDINDNSRSKFICLAECNEAKKHKKLRARVGKANEVVEEIEYRIHTDRKALRTLYKKSGETLNHNTVRRAEERVKEYEEEISGMERLIEDISREISITEAENRGIEKELLDFEEFINRDKLVKRQAQLKVWEQESANRFKKVIKKSREENHDFWSS